MRKLPIVLYCEVKDFHPDDILGYYAEHEHLSLEEARDRWEEMLKFLVLCVSSDNVHAPSEAVDGAWHAFVLHTEQYEQFCLDRLGVFVHHRPKPQPIEEFKASLAEVFESFPGTPTRRHLWVPNERNTLAALADCEDGGTQCVGQCAEKGCSKHTAPRRVRLNSVFALSGA